MDGNRIRKIREKKKMSQSELAKRLKVDRSYINKIENNKNKPSIPLLERIAHELGCSVKDFF